MRSLRSVTRQPMGMPSRSLNAAMDFLARVITAFCPAMTDSSFMASSISLLFWLAEPRPMFSEILTIPGICMGELYANSFCNTGTTFSR